MSYNVLNNDTTVGVSDLCVYDSNIAYDADLSSNGDVNGWTYYDGIHTYGCWNNFLFGTLYGSFALIGRYTAITGFEANHYTKVRIAMKLRIVDRATGQNLPTKGKIMWKTSSDSSWDDYKSKEFDIISDESWHNYIINVSDSYYWQGNVNDLRIYPIYEDGRDGDEFFIRAVQVRSDSYFSCRNQSCAYYQAGTYEHGCDGVGVRGYVLGAISESSYYSFTDDDYLIVNINGYGEERIKLKELSEASGVDIAKILTSNMGRVNIGGYSEGSVEYTTTGAFRVYSGTYHESSTVDIGFNQTAVKLGFWSSGGVKLYSSVGGTTPADGFKPNSSMRASSYQLNSLFDNSDKSSVEFNPYIYNVEGGRSDFLVGGLGDTENDMAASVDDYSGNIKRDYSMIDCFDKTIIDVNHPFSASGRVKKIYISCSLDIDMGSEASDADRVVAVGAKVKVYRPRKDGTLKCVEEVDIPNRNSMQSNLYSQNQEAEDLDCDIFVNKGDLLGVYNVSMYVGKTLVDGELDATYYLLNSEHSVNEELDPGKSTGEGSAGLLVYARSDQIQKSLVLDIDLGSRINIDNVLMYGEESAPNLEYNVARCVDINWQLSTFGLSHTTSYMDAQNGLYHTIEMSNTGYGLDRLSDGVYNVPGGKAADSFSSDDSSGVVPTNPYYFWVNGDHEWMGVHYFTEWWQAEKQVYDFKGDPLAFYIEFPHGRSKTIYKSTIYFKDRYNFRNIALSYYLGENKTNGNADLNTFKLIPQYTAITLDGVSCEYGEGQYDSMADYIFQNPATGHPETVIVGGPGIYMDPESELPGEWQFLQRGTILNIDSMNQAVNVDWQVITHEWDPIEAYGFRIYCDWHESTKICEIELFGRAPDSGSSLSGGISLTYSMYGDYWFAGDVSQESTDTVVCSVKDTPRYMTMEISPITRIKITDINFTPSKGDVYIGEKGCEYEVFLTNSKSGEINKSQKIDIKNVYGGEYDLYVDISDAGEMDNGLVFYSTLGSSDKVSNPVVGPGARYEKSDDYPLKMDNNNVAINCDVWGLRNLVLGKKAFYSYDNNYSWQEFNEGQEIETELLEFNNLPNSSYSVIKIPVLSRSKYWKLVFLCDDDSINVREIKAYSDGVELDANFYYNNNVSDFYNSAVDGNAPHLNNESVTGSYYVLDDDSCIGIELPGVDELDKIVLYHDTKADYVYSSDETIKWSIYVSEDNFAYGKYADIDLMRDGSFSYHDPESTFSNTYYSYLAIDLGRSHDLSLVRSYGSASAASFSLTENVVYSSIDTDDPYTAFLSLSTGSVDDNFNLEDGDLPGNWDVDYTNGYIRIDDNKLLFKANGGSSTDISTAASKYFIDGDFELEFYYELKTKTDIGQWRLQLLLEDTVSTDNNNLYFERGFLDGANKYKIYFDDDGNTVTTYNAVSSDWRASIKIRKTDTLFEIYTKPYESTVWTELTYYELTNRAWNTTRVYFKALSESGAYPIIEYYIDDLKINYGAIYWSVYNDARWLKIALLNGDGVSRVVNKIGVYPDVQTQFASDGYYNCEWDDMGKSVTSFFTQRNLADGVTVSGSSVFGELYYDNVVDGVKEYDFSKIWGSDDEDDNPWFVLDLGAEYEVYRFKVFHGVIESDTDFIINDYTISYSNDAVNYTTVFTVVDNYSFERTHDLATPVTVRWVKFYVDSFSSRNIYLKDEDNKYKFFSGAVLREFEVYEYYGFELISSEEYPIVAVNLGYQYYLQNQPEVVGVDAESTAGDWSDGLQYFCYSDSVFDDPRKVFFDGWGCGPHYEQWVVIKRDTATEYNSGPDYLKHLVVKSIDKQNPCEHPQWWRSYYSTITADYSNGGVNAVSSLEIIYPASTQTDVISFIEGDDFGIDSIASWRDGLSFVMNMDGSENIDLDSSYFFLGGYDTTVNAYEVIYKWYFSTVSGIINDIKKNVFLRFKSADVVDYTVSADLEDDDARIVSNMTLKKLGVVLKGTGAGQVNLRFDGFKIQRNHFYDGLYEDYGLYLTAGDVLTAPLSDFRMSSGALSFWIRLDYNFLSTDEYGVSKNRVLFHLNNVHNDVFGCQISKLGLEFYVGNLEGDLHTLTIEGEGIPVDELFHMGITFSNNGKSIDSDGSTIRVYINGQFYVKMSETWEYRDGKSFSFVIGGNGIMASRIGVEGSSADAVIGSLKLYSYCKTDFLTDLLTTVEEQVSIYKASSMIEVSKDNVTFYKVGSSELPFKFDLVPDGDTISIYVKSVVPNNLTGYESRTAGIIVQWDVGV